MGFIKDIWRVGVAPCPLERAMEPGALIEQPVVWFSNPDPLGFYADPFGLWRDDRLFLFVERFEYRRRHGTIEVFTLDRELRVLDQRPALQEPWHLSYPFVFEHGNELYMLPEAFQSGGLTLYRADRFPDRWSPVAHLELDAVPIDATPLFHEGLWWLFYAPASPEAAKTRALHLAFAEDLLGPWRPHPRNPVRYDVASARPGGAPFISNGKPVLPVQDCTTTYGGGLRPLVIEELTPERFRAQPGPLLQTPAAWRPYSLVHTLSGAGEVTLIDAKRGLLTPASLALDVRRQARKLANAF